MMCVMMIALSIVFRRQFMKEQVRAFVDALKLVKIGYSWGGVTSLAVAYDFHSIPAPRTMDTASCGSTLVSKMSGICRPTSGRHSNRSSDLSFIRKGAGGKV